MTLGTAVGKFTAMMPLVCVRWFTLVVFIYANISNEDKTLFHGSNGIIDQLAHQRSTGERVKYSHIVVEQ